jgi:hypothetical protein
MFLIRQPTWTRRAGRPRLRAGTSSGRLRPAADGSPRIRRVRRGRRSGPRAGRRAGRHLRSPGRRPCPTPGVVACAASPTRTTRPLLQRGAGRVVDVVSDDGVLVGRCRATRRARTACRRRGRRTTRHGQPTRRGAPTLPVLPPPTPGSARRFTTTFVHLRGLDAPHSAFTRYWSAVALMTGGSSHHGRTGFAPATSGGRSRRRAWRDRSRKPRRCSRRGRTR